MKKKLFSILLMMIVGSFLVACGSEKGREASDTSTAKEIQSKIDDQCNNIDAIVKEHEDLWKKLYKEEGNTEDKADDTTVCSGYLAKLIEKNGKLLSENEKNTLIKDVEKIQKIENKLNKLEKQYSKFKESGNKNNSSAEKFPDFKGKDLDGKAVDSSIFRKNKVTIVNFWFSTCSPCVGELDKLNELNEQLKEKGGAVIGINTDTLDGSEVQIKEAKRILKKKGAVYQNIWFSRKSEVGKFVKGIVGFPTTYVVDSNGKIVGEPLMGGIDYPDVKKLLQLQINKALGDSDNKTKS